MSSLFFINSDTYFSTGLLLGWCSCVARYTRWAGTTDSQYLTVWRWGCGVFVTFFRTSVADPCDQYFFGPPGSGSISMRHGFGSGSGKKNLDSYCFVTSLWLSILEKWCKCTVVSIGNNQQTLEKTYPLSTPQTLLDVIKLILFLTWILCLVFLNLSFLLLRFSWLS